MQSKRPVTTAHLHGAKTGKQLSSRPWRERDHKHTSQTVMG